LPERGAVRRRISLITTLLSWSPLLADAGFEDLGVQRCEG
jgi:hypothetical protein